MATAAPSKQDHRRMCAEHLADFRGYLADLPQEAWDEPSLCAGWKVRDVVGHLTVGRLLSLPAVAKLAAKGGFRIDAVVDRASREYAAAHTPEEILAAFSEETSRPKERGLAGIQPPHGKLADNLTHLLDISVPLGRDAGIPAERLEAVLHALPRLGFWKTKQRTAGLRLVAEDVDWEHGAGVEVRGPAHALILALGGRGQVLDRLSGPGVELLRPRVAA